MGETVRATIADTTTAAAKVNANSLNSAPVNPPTRRRPPAWPPWSGRERLRAPQRGLSLLPSSIRRWTFSTTTIASSTTSPMARTIASKVRIQAEAKRQHDCACAQQRQRNAEHGHSHRAERAQEQENDQTTSTLARTSFRSTLSIAASMNTVTSYGMAMLDPAGKSSLFNTALTSREIASIPAGRCHYLKIDTGSPFMLAT